MLVDVLKNPEFPPEKIDLYLAQARAGISKRNDQPGGIASREMKKSLYGVDSPYAKVTEYANLDKIDRKALQEYHAKIYHPNMFIVGVVGDFKKDEMLAKLKAKFEPWAKQAVDLPKAEPIPTTHVARNLFVERPKLNQTTIMMGHVVDILRNSPDYAAVQLMNEILAGGMSARMFTEVRTKKRPRLFRRRRGADLLQSSWSLLFSRTDPQRTGARNHRSRPRRNRPFPRQGHHRKRARRSQAEHPEFVRLQLRFTVKKSLAAR